MAARFTFVAMESIDLRCLYGTVEWQYPSNIILINNIYFDSDFKAGRLQPFLFNNYHRLPNKLTPQQLKSITLVTDLTKEKMFRNIYIQAYKNSIQQNSTLQMMLIHANHVYAGLGCILQDIQFMVGNVLAHFKTSADGTKRVKNETKQRISMPEKLQEISFKMPKYQFLPSSSFKYENFEIPRPKFNQPEQMRSNNIQQSVQKRNDSFQEMFPQKRKTRPSMESSDNEKSKKPLSNPPAARNDPSPSPQSQEDFMDYLFKKKNKD